MTPSAHTGEKTALYRMFDGDHVLLYVGISYRLGARWEEECRQALWWPLVKRQTVIWYDSRPEAEEAEDVAIKSESPLFNLKGIAGKTIENPGNHSKQLGRKLRLVRKLAGLSGSDIAFHVNISQAGVSRVESGHTLLTLPQIAAWAAASGASDDTHATLAMLARSAFAEIAAPNAPTDKDFYSIQQEALATEAASGAIVSFHPVFIPQLLQTAEYARRTFGLIDATGRRGGASAAVATLLERQQFLYQPERRFEFLITEAALRQRVGPAHVMRGQIDRIISVMSLDTVKVGVIPLNLVAGLPIGPWWGSEQNRIGFDFYDNFIDGRFSSVAMELMHGRTTVNSPENVEIYVKHLTAIRSAALHGINAMRLLGSIDFCSDLH